MTRRISVVVILCAAALGGIATFTAALAGTEKSAPPQDQVQQLRERVEKLEARLADLEQRVPRVIVPVQNVPQLRALPQGKLETLPKGWIPKEFNGLLYYDIPLANMAK